MITFKNFLFENISTEDYLNDEDDILINNIIDKIKHDCQPWLKATSGKLFYRGINSLLGKQIFFTKLSVRQDRKNRNSRQELHNAWDKYFKEKFGFEYRSKGLFITNYEHQANLFGKLYIVFPIGEIEYIYSVKIHDLLDAFGSKFKNNVGIDINTYLDTNKYGTEFYDLVKENMDYFNYVKNMPLNRKFHLDGTEIMVKCSSYYAILYDLPYITQKNLEEKLTKALGH